MKKPALIAAALFLVPASLSAQQIHDRDAPASVPLITRAIPIDANGVADKTQIDSGIPVWRGSTFSGVIRYANPLWGDVETNQADGEVAFPVDIPLEVHPAYDNVSGNVAQLQSVFSLKEGYDLYTREDESGVWKRGNVFHSADAQALSGPDFHFQAIIKKSDEKGALGGKASRIYNGFVGLKIALGFLPDGKSAGYLSFIDPSGLGVSNFQEPVYYPFYGTAANATSPLVQIERTLIPLNHPIAPDFNAVTRVISPQVTLDVSFADHSLYPEKVVDQITVSDNESSQIVVIYKFYYYADTSEFPAGSGSFTFSNQYVVVRRTEGENIKYSVLHQTANSSSSTKYVAAPFQAFTLTQAEPAGTSDLPFFEQFSKEFITYPRLYRQVKTDSDQNGTHSRIWVAGEGNGWTISQSESVTEAQGIDADGFGPFLKTREIGYLEDDPNALESLITQTYLYSGDTWDGTNGNFFSWIFGYSSYTVERASTERPPAFERTTRGVWDFETAFHTTETALPFPDGTERTTSIEYYPLDWVSTTPFSPIQDSETFLKSVVESVSYDPGAGPTTLEVGRVEYDPPVFTTDPTYGEDLIVTGKKTYRNASEYLASAVKTYHPHCSDWLADLPYVEELADGTKRVYLYEKGAYFEDGQGTGQYFETGGPNTGDLRITVLNGVKSLTGGTAATAWNLKSIEPIYMVPGKSAVAVTYRTQYGLTERTETRVFNGGAANEDLPILNFSKMRYNGAGHLIYREDERGRIYKAEYTANPTARYANDGTGRRGQKVWERLEDGREYHYSYDFLGRVKTRTQLSKSALEGSLGPVATRFEYDDDSRVTLKETGAVAGGADPTGADSAVALVDPVTTGFTFNSAGELISKTQQTNYTTTVNKGNFVDTETFPGGATRITAYNEDGSVSSITGSGVVAQYYDYGLETQADGSHFQTVTVYLGTDGRQAGVQVKSSGEAERAGNFRYVKIVRDWLGNTVREVRSAGDDGGSAETVAQYEFNAEGLLEWRRRDALSKEVFEYDEFAQLERSGLDLNDTGALDPDSADRINDTENEYEFINGQWWRVTRNYTFSDSDTTAPHLVSIARRRMTGLGASETEGVLAAVEAVEDANGKVTTTKTWVGAANAKATRKTWSPRFSNPTVSIYVNGKLMRATTPSGVATQYEYDGHGRLSRVIDARAGATEYAYYPLTGELKTVKQPHPDSGALIATRQVVYDSAGRTQSEQNADGKFTYFDYNGRNQLIHTWGDVPYPVTYAYDAFGQLQFKYTYRTGADSDWAVSTLPVGFAVNGDATENQYFARSGLLKKRIDARGNFTEYGYRDDGRLETRAWMREYAPGQKIVTTYAYFAGSAELASVAYNDGATPALSYAYHRNGAIRDVTESGLGTFTYAYRANDFKVDEISLPAYFGSGQVVKYNYDAQGFFRGAAFGPSANPDTFFTDYNIDAQNGRLASVVSPAGTFNFDYAAGSDLIERRRHALGTGGEFKYETLYNSHRDACSEVSAWAGTAKLVAYGYDYDALMRRESVAMTGALFDKYALGGAGLANAYQYNARNELTDATATQAGSAAPIPGRDFNYRYDPIGNRLFALVDEEPDAGADYTSNALNQYAGRETGGDFLVSGFINSGTGATVSLTQNGQSAGNAVLLADSDTFFSKALTKSNPTAAGIETVDVAATIPSPLAAAEESREQATRPAAESFTYDADGNLLSDSLWTYAYDAENRLTKAESALPFADGMFVTVDYEYDYMGRRIGKTVSHDDGLGAPVVQSIKRFVWVGWQLLAELDVDPETSEAALQRTYTWGPDLSGSVGGAGHIGGLLALQDHRETADPVYLAGYDGNGNLTTLSDADDGSLAAAYEYSPFGELLRATGPYAEENPFRFSTKYYDSESGLSYYGFRYYSASMGRFVNRDPLEERGGFALYRDLSLATTNPFFGGGNLPGRGFLEEWKEKQDALLRNTSLTHSTEELQLGGYRNSTLASTFEEDKKFYSANAAAHDNNQGGSKGLEFDSFPSPTSSFAPSNSDINLYIFAGNNPINGYDAFGLVLGTGLTFRELVGAAASGARQGAEGAALVGAGFVPYVGDIVGTGQDVYDVANPNSSNLERGLGAASITANAMTLGVAPNVGPIKRGVQKIFGKVLNKLDNVADARKLGNAANKGTEVVQRAMSRDELKFLEKKGVLRFGRKDTTFVSDAVNSNANRARQRLALPNTPQVRATVEVPAGKFSPPTKVEPLKLPSGKSLLGGGAERMATGVIPAKIIKIDEF